LLVKYIPTETLALYIALQAALGDVPLPASGKISDADFGRQWTAAWIMLGVTAFLAVGLSYRSQKNANRRAPFKFPFFEMLAASAAFLIWSLSLPSTPLRSIAGYDYSVWNSFIILAGTTAIAVLAYVLGKTVSLKKFPTAPPPPTA
jgi:hypothetical protein